MAPRLGPLHAPGAVLGLSLVAMPRLLQKHTVTTLNSGWWRDKEGWGRSSFCSALFRDPTWALQASFKRGLSRCLTFSAEFVLCLSQTPVLPLVPRPQ